MFRQLWLEGQHEARPIPVPPAHHLYPTPSSCRRPPSAPSWGIRHGGRIVSRARERPVHHVQDVGTIGVRCYRYFRLKEATPSEGLRRWFGHDPAKWADFQRRYCSELDRKPETWRLIVEAAHRGNVTLLYSARDTAHNNAVALKRVCREGPRGSP
jgi:Protein of unknown function, DUF488